MTTNELQPANGQSEVITAQAASRANTERERERAAAQRKAA